MNFNNITAVQRARYEELLQKSKDHGLEESEKEEKRNIEIASRQTI